MGSGCKVGGSGFRAVPGRPICDTLRKEVAWNAVKKLRNGKPAATNVGT